VFYYLIISTLYNKEQEKKVERKDPIPVKPKQETFLYSNKNWVPPFQEILQQNLCRHECNFSMQISLPQDTMSFGCKCRNTSPGCKRCQRRLEYTVRLYEDATLKANEEIDKMFNCIQGFRDECKIFKKKVFEGLSYVHFLRMVQNSMLQYHRIFHHSSFNFSDFDGFFRKDAIFFPVSQKLKEAGKRCRISEKDLKRFVEFPNSGKRVSPEFGHLSARNEILKMLISMKIIHLFSKKTMHQNCKNRFVLERHIANRVFESKITFLFIQLNSN
jgi:hypothetical protein